MISVLLSTWALFLGMFLLMLGNGMQGTLIGIRGGIEHFSTFQMSLVMSGYFSGFLFGSVTTPKLIQRVGHVRVFAALGSMISAVLVLYAVAPDWRVWIVLRMLIGFSFAGVYIVAESWLNNASNNQNRGQALSLYMMVQMTGIITAQMLLNFGDPAGYVLFIIPSVLVSLAFTPILLSVSPAPAYESTKAMRLSSLYKASPLGVVGIFLVGGVFSTQFGMSAVWGSEQGLSVKQVTLFVSAIYSGGLLLQYPMGWLSDRLDRRKIVFWLSAVGAIFLALPMLFDLPFALLLIIGAMSGAVVNPLYSLLLAYVNDYLDSPDMPAASAGLMFINGLGAIFGPIVTGWMMAWAGPGGFFLYMSLLFLILACYALWRMRRRPKGHEVTSSYTAVMPTASVVTLEATMIVSDSAVDESPGDDKKTNAL